MNNVLLSLGANLGNKSNTLKVAFMMLEESMVLVDCKMSSLYETEPVGIVNQPEFINACLVCKTRLLPIELYLYLQSIEHTLGRIKRERWHEREIDIDIILYGHSVISIDNLVIPHKRMHERRFVLQPACEIASDMLHPSFNKTISELLLLCDDNSRVRLFKE